MKKSDDDDNYAEWMMLFEEQASEANGYDETKDLDRDLMDELYDEDMDVFDAISEYLERDIV